MTVLKIGPKNICLVSARGFGLPASRGGRISQPLRGLKRPNSFKRVGGGQPRLRREDHPKSTRGYNFHPARRGNIKLPGN
jgi:hypothetical protein